MNIAHRLPLLAIVVGLHAGSAGAETVIDSLPFSANQDGETYVLQEDLSTYGSAITINADNVAIDGRGHRITYANSQAGNAIFIGTPVTGLEIKNLTMKQGNYDPRRGENVHAVVGAYDHQRVNIHHNVIDIGHTGSKEGAFGWGIKLSGNTRPSFNNFISNNIIRVSGVSGGYGIYINADAPWKGNITNNLIELSEMQREPAGYGRAIALGGPGPIKIENNEIRLSSDIFQAQGISLWGAHNNVIRDNFLQIDSYKTRAILVDGNSDNNRILRNKIVLTSKRSPDASAGIRIRYGSDNNKVIRNEVDASEAAYAFGLRLGGSGDYGESQGTVVRRNIFRSSSRAVSLEGALGVEFQGNEILATGQGWNPAVYFNNARNIDFDGDQIQGVIDMKGEVSGVHFCSTNVTEGQLHQTGDDYRISNSCGSSQNEPAEQADRDEDTKDEADVADGDSSDNPQGEASVTLRWEEPRLNTDGSPLRDLIAYEIAYGMTANAYNNTIDVDFAEVDCLPDAQGHRSCSYTIDNLSEGSWYFGIRSVDMDGHKSAYSDAVSATAK